MGPGAGGQRSRRRGALVSLTALCLATTAAAPALGAQQTIDITGDACATCTIEAQRIGVVGSREDPALFTLRSTVARDSQGRMMVARVYEPGRFSVYHASGEFSHLQGRSGDGPGEFRSIDRITIGPGDSVHVFADGRWAVFPPGAVDPVARTLRVAGFARANPVFLSDGNLVWHGSIEGHREPLHLLTAEGERLRSFGWLESDPQPGNIYQMTRRIAPSSDSTRIWTARANRYTIDEWDPRTGRATRIINRDVPWFDPWTSESSGVPDNQRTNTNLLDIAVDPDGLVWLLFMVPAESRPDDRADAPPPSPANEREYAQRVRGPTARERSWDTRIEVLDPAAGVVRYSGTFDEFFVGFESAGVVHRRIELSDGVILIERWEMEPAPDS